MRCRGRHAVLATLLASLIGAAHAAAQGCAMCGTVLGANDPRTNAFKWGIVFLMATPYVLVGAVAVWLFLNARRSRTGRGGRPGAEVGGLAADYKESLT